MIKGKTAAKQSKDKQKNKTKKKAYLKAEKANWPWFQGLKLEDLEFLCILRRQQDAGLWEVMSELRLCLDTGLRRDLISRFLFALGPGFHFIKGFIRVYNFFCEQHRLHTTKI